MKKLFLLLVSCSLALAVTSIAKAEEPPKKKGPPPAKHAVRTPRGPAVQARARGPQGGTHRSNITVNRPPTHTATQSRISGHTTHTNNFEHHRQPALNAHNARPATNAERSPKPGVAATGARPELANHNGQPRKVDPQVVQKVTSEHANFRAQARPETVPATRFNQNYRINGADRWQGAQYQTFRSYHPEMHDQGWYRSHYNRIEIIAGGAYFWNEGYWYPAWGYDPAAQYYPYDGPIYVGSRAEPPDRVIADVQSVLQAQGYYRGEVDGLLGPLTREALSAYQADNGLYTTAAIDEPTLDALGLG